MKNENALIGPNETVIGEGAEEYSGKLTGLEIRKPVFSYRPCYLLAVCLG